MRIQNIIQAVAVLAILFLSGAAIAEEMTLPITSYAEIINRSDVRLLVNIPIPDEIEDSNLTFAELRFGIIPRLAGDSILTINCHAVTSTWSPDNVGWNVPWLNPGGDFEPDEFTFFTTASAENGEIQFDITETIRSWLNGNRPNFGLIFIIPERISSRFELDRLPDLPNGAIGFVRIVKSH